MSVVALAQNIRALKAAVSDIKDNTQDRITVITQEVQFTGQDNKDFTDLMSEIKQDSLRKMALFYQQRIHERTKTYQKELTDCETDYSETCNQIVEQQELVKQKIDNNMYKKQNYEQLVLKMVLNQDKRRTITKSFKSLKEYSRRRAQKRQQYEGAEQKYYSTLTCKVFYPWRGMCHKSGYQNMLVNQASKDIKNLQQQFLDIIKVLKNQIADTDDQLNIKKNAKAEFSYALSRNILKTISNLSMEVMSLNQVTIKDNQISNDDNTKFLKKMNTIIASKLNNVQAIKDKLRGDTKTSIQFEN